MLLGTYRFHCRFLTPATVPAHKGSMLRGAFGRAFKRVSCALRRRECATCLLTATCPYSVVFENHATGHEGAGNAPARLVARPHPYIMQAPGDTCLAYGPDEAFTFDIFLFGKANAFLPHIVCAVQLMGEEGLGAGAKTHGAGRFSLTSVLAQGQEIYHQEGKTLRQLPPLCELYPPSHCKTVNSSNTEFFDLTFLTPLRLKHHNHFQDVLPFHVVIRAALRRMAALETYYGDGEPPLDYRGLVQRAESVTIVSSACRWLDWERYSSRQKTAMLLGGLVGTIRYAGQVDEFLPILRYCEQTQLGKQTTFGLGRISLTPRPTA